MDEPRLPPAVAGRSALPTFLAVAAWARGKTADARDAAEAIRTEADAEAVCDWHERVFADEGTGPRFYVEMQHHIAEQNAINPHLIKLAREGDDFEVGPGDVRTISFISVEGINVEAVEPSQGLNALNQLGVRLGFTDGSVGVFLVQQLPCREPLCRVRLPWG